MCLLKRSKHDRAFESLLWRLGPLRRQRAHDRVHANAIVRRGACELGSGQVDRRPSTRAVRKAMSGESNRAVRPASLLSAGTSRLGGTCPVAALAAKEMREAARHRQLPSARSGHLASASGTRIAGAEASPTCPQRRQTRTEAPVPTWGWTAREWGPKIGR